MNLLQRITSHQGYDLVAALLITANAIMIGVQADWSATYPFEDLPTEFGVAETFFCWVFTFELLLRLIARGKTFLTQDDANWNCFDVLVVGVALAEWLMGAIGSGDEMPNLTAARVIRLLRLVKMAR